MAAAKRQKRVRKAGGARKGKKGGLHVGRLDFSGKDAKRVQRAARRHAAALGTIGVTVQEIDQHRDRIAEVSKLLARRAGNKSDETTVITDRDDALQKALDRLAHVRRMADLEFNDSRPPATRDRKALTAFGIGQPIPRTVDDLEVAIQGVKSALADKKHTWKQDMAKRGINDASIKTIEDKAAEAKTASTGKSTATTGRREATSALDEPAAEMRRLTSYLRKAGNDVFMGQEQRKDFDPPARPRTKKRAAKGKPANGEQAAAAAGGK
jgi:hypothetical protein